ncbi:hypothetical protein BP6252_06829 [Coleophoma cylindrospora]|uniref:Cutinase n=1 Tax=Coleophoma cylindrospora TaxID=1849047 RepID=A0A3D8RFV8_9HELO|nr:hypothetical protein BP6252_06829 [Coleophoma cylindrospora]
MKTCPLILLLLASSVLAIPIQNIAPFPGSIASSNSTPGANPDTSNPEITFSNAQTNPDEVVAAIYNETIADISANNTDPDNSTNATTGGVTPAAFGKSSGNGGGPPNSPLNVLLAAVGKFPIVGKELKVVGDVLTGLEAALAKVLNVQTTENEAGCTSLTVIFARGTTEPGNAGLVTGPPFFDALNSMLGAKAVTIQGVDYGASIEGFLEGGDPAGGRLMAQMVQDSLQKCPTSKVVMSGYSQGGQIVHNAANLLPAATMAKVNSVVIFGDPDFGTPVTGAVKQKIICHADDNICQHGDLILLSHLTYGENAQEAATFVAASAGLAIGTPGL